MSRPRFQVGDIFRRFGEAYRSRHRLPLQQHRIMRAIEVCRTAALGGHIDRCGSCTHERISYNSCRNRHCPKCQNTARAAWVERRKSELLPVEYFHVVFTIPAELNAVALQNKSAVYNILFDASAETLLTIAADRRHLGARIGFFSILHTWGQNLLHHPHVHCVATGGGLSPAGQWVACRPGFFLSVRVLSRLFRRLFLSRIRLAFEQDDLRFEGSQTEARVCFAALLDELGRSEWVVYAKPPFGGPARVIEYLGRYTHRVALSNDRIQSIENDRITFRYKDYRSGKGSLKLRSMTISAEEFIRRFLLHTIPPGFARIRHYGLLAGRNKGRLLPVCRNLLEAPSVLPSQQELEQYKAKLSAPAFLCPQCGQGQMIRIRRFRLHSASASTNTS